MADTRDLGIASALVGAAPTILTKNPSVKYPCEFKSRYPHHDLGKSINYLYAPLAQWQSTWLLTKVS